MGYLTLALACAAFAFALPATAAGQAAPVAPDDGAEVPVGTPINLRATNSTGEQVYFIIGSDSNYEIRSGTRSDSRDVRKEGDIYEWTAPAFQRPGTYYWQPYNYEYRSYMGSSVLVHGAPRSIRITAPPCDPATPPEFVLKAPTRVAFGRDGQVEITASKASYWKGQPETDANADAASEEVSVGSVDAAHPARPEAVKDEGYQGFFFSPVTGSGPARITATWQEVHAGGLACMRQASAVITPFIGIYPTAHVKADGSTLEWTVGTKYEDCSLDILGAASVTVRGVGTKKTVRLTPDECEFRKTRDLKIANGWTLQQYDGDFTFESKTRKRGTQRFTYAVAIGSRSIRRGAFTVKTVVYPGHTVWEETDEFVNFCINENRRIWSSGGRLYCHSPGFVSRRIRVVR